MLNIMVGAACLAMMDNTSTRIAVIKLCCQLAAFAVMSLNLSTITREHAHFLDDRHELRKRQLLSALEEKFD